MQILIKIDIKVLLEEGVPLHYVGAQCHDDLSFYTEFPGYIDSVKRYSRRDQIQQEILCLECVKMMTSIMARGHKN